MPRWLKVPEACGYARMSRKVLMRHIKLGEIYGTKRFGHWIVKQESIDQFYEEEEAILLEWAKRAGEEML